MTEATKGVLAIVGACVIWGFATLYYKAMSHVPPLEVLAHRSLWTLVLFGAVLALRGRLSQVWRLIAGSKGPRVALAGAIVALNWGLFIFAIQAGYAVEASLGYYIFPLVTVVMGVVILGERLSRAQGAAVMLAALAVGLLTWGLGVAPWMALALAFSFAPYMLMKKKLDAPAAVSVTAEVALIAPFALALLVWAALGGQIFGRAGGWFGADLYSTLMLPVTGMVPVLPDFTAQRFPGLGQFASHLFMSVNMIGALVGAPVAGLLSDRQSSASASISRRITPSMWSASTCVITSRSKRRSLAGRCRMRSRSAG